MPELMPLSRNGLPALQRRRIITIMGITIARTTQTTTIFDQKLMLTRFPHPSRHRPRRAASGVGLRIGIKSAEPRPGAATATEKSQGVMDFNSTPRR